MDELLTKNDKRTKYCGEFTAEDIGSYVCVTGWVQRQRDLGSLIFIDLRDRTGIIQLAFDEKTDSKIFEKAFGIRAEYVLCAKGYIRSRGEGAINLNRATGAVEIAVDELKILSAAETPPFEIVENSDVRIELRLKHRYLDLRRPDMQRNIIARSKIAKITRDFFADNNFIEIETPNLIKPTPEGARDYLVPSRVHPGSFYALPQSPQLYKQLLMLSGFDRYIQIARCYRDEDLRADRQPEFTQIDLEMSFVTQDDILQVVENYLKYLFNEFKGINLETPLLRMCYQEAMTRFGSDKPDLRFGFELVNISEAIKNCGFKVFTGAVASGGSVRGINIKNGADKFSRKEIDALTEFVKTYRAKGLAWYKNNNGEISSSYAKFLTEEENQAINTMMDIQKGDLAFIVADKDSVVFDSLGALRCNIAKRLNLINPSEYKLLWVTDFPLLEYSEDDNRYVSKHHPFTMPMAEDIAYLDTDPAKVRSIAYDIVINGTEAGGGSIRIHTPEIQSKMFEVLGLTKEEANEKFGFLLEAFKYGTPPHGGLAFGLDRLTTLLLGLDDIRDVIAFPKVQNASELMTKCPAPADEKALNELGIIVVKKEDKNN
ncbi:MAG: aspartate--tRNA ligase [Eubacteriales bacterium]